MTDREKRTLDIQQRRGEYFEAFEDVDPRIPHVIRQKGQQNVSMAIDICISKDGRLCYYDGERGHMLDGKLHKKRRSGFEWKYIHQGGSSEILRFDRMTMDDFDAHLRQFCTDELSAKLQDLDDVCIWYRRLAGIV